MKISGINRLPWGKRTICQSERFETTENQIILERSQGTAPCPSSGGGCISVDTYSACRLCKNIIKESNSYARFPLLR
jgi:hypothetical protein